MLPVFQQRLAAHMPARHLVRLPGARLLGRHGLVLLPDGAFVAESIYSRAYLKVDPDYQTRLRPKAQDMPGDYCSLIGEFAVSGNYFHWAHDGLLRLHGLIDSLPPHVKYNVPGGLQPYQRDMLNLLGIAPERLVYFPGNAVWRLQTLHFASLPPTGVDSAGAERWLRDRLLAACGVARTSPKRRLYISRQDAGYGRVVNEAEVLACLARFGFEECMPGNLSICEQAALFSEAEAIITPHGSGLTNMLYARPGTPVLDIFEPVWAEAHAFVLWSMADALEHDYWYMLGEAVPNPQVPSRPDILVPLDKLARVVEQMPLAA